MKTPGPQNPGVLTHDVKSAERSCYFFFAAFFLAAGFFAAFFLAAMMALPPSLRTRTRYAPLGQTGPHEFMDKFRSLVRGRRLCAGNLEQHHYRDVVINERDHFCQWSEEDCVRGTLADFS
jgi:hypothetical protein